MRASASAVHAMQLRHHKVHASHKHTLHTEQCRQLLLRAYPQPSSHLSCMPLELASVRLTSWGPDVYEPSDDTFLLADALEEHAALKWNSSFPRTIVELGCGSGYVICSLALICRQLNIKPNLLALDHNHAAVNATKATLAAHKVDTVEVVLDDILNIPCTGEIDVLVFNPPYVPTPDVDVGGSDITSAWAGGYKGRRVIDRLLPQLPALLSSTGQMFLVTVSENDPQGIISEMQSLGFAGTVLCSRQADEETLSIVHLSRGNVTGT